MFISKRVIYVLETPLNNDVRSIIYNTFFGFQILIVYPLICFFFSAIRIQFGLHNESVLHAFKDCNLSTHVWNHFQFDFLDADQTTSDWLKEQPTSDKVQMFDTMVIVCWCADRTLTVPLIWSPKE